MPKLFAINKKPFLVAAFTATMLFMARHGEAKVDAALAAAEAAAKRTQMQISAIPTNFGIRYIGDPEAGLCYAGHISKIGVSDSRLTLFVVPCTKEVLALIPNEKDRPNFKPQEPADPALNLK